MSSEIAAICASKDVLFKNLILFLKKFLPRIALNLVKFFTGPLCFINPSRVSRVRFKEE